MGDNYLIEDVEKIKNILCKIHNESCAGNGSDFFISDNIVAYIVGMVTTIIAVMFGHCLTLRIKKKRYNEKIKRKKKLYIALLGDEILFRWFGRIKPHLEEKLKGSPAQVRGKISNTKFSSYDLYVFKKCAEDYYNMEHFVPESTASKMVYIHILTQDIADAIENMKSMSDADINVKIIDLKNIIAHTHKQMMDLMSEYCSEYINSYEDMDKHRVEMAKKTIIKTFKKYNYLRDKNDLNNLSEEIGILKSQR